MNHGLIIKGGLRAGNLSSTGELVAAKDDICWSVTRVVISASAALNVTIENGSGTDLIGPIYMAANSNYFAEFEPGAVVAASGVAINCVASASNATTVAVECVGI